jgi:hypothetical protein
MVDLTPARPRLLEQLSEKELLLSSSRIATAGRDEIQPLPDHCQQTSPPDRTLHFSASARGVPVRGAAQHRARTLPASGLPRCRLPALARASAFGAAATSSGKARRNWQAVCS